MLNIRVHRVMGQAAVSVWCVDVPLGHDHCLWSATRWLDAGDGVAVLEVCELALSHVHRLAERGELESLTDDCLG